MTNKSSASKKEYDRVKGKEYRNRPEVKKHRNLYGKYWRAKNRTANRAYARGIARLRNHGVTEEELAAMLGKQGNRCAYSGVRLHIGGNLSIDHIKSVSEYPQLQYDKSNLQLLDGYVSRAKSDLTEEEFLLMVKLIYEHKNLGVIDFTGVEMPKTRKKAKKVEEHPPSEYEPLLKLRLLTPEQDSARKSAWERGLNDTQIAEECNCGRWAVTSWRKTRDLKHNRGKKSCLGCGKDFVFRANTKRCPECRASAKAWSWA